MASLAHIARSVIASAILLLAVLLVFGCGGGDGQSAQVVEWGVARPLGPRQIKLVTSVNHCGGEPAPVIEQPVIKYSGRKVFIELHIVPEEKVDDGGCLLELLGVSKTVTLKRDLDELTLFDASTNPPERRWPTEGSDLKLPAAAERGIAPEGAREAGGSGALKETRWEVSRVAAHSVQISAFVPYCGEPHRKPYIQRVDRRRGHDRVVLTMLVRYPPVRGACLGEGLGVARWIAVRGDPRRLKFFDGSQSPPILRWPRRDSN